MRWVVPLVVLAGCGRIGFDTTGDGAEPPPRTGLLDPTFGTGGYTVAGTDLSRRVFDLARSSTGYVTVGVNQVGRPTFETIGFTRTGQLDPAYGTGGIAVGGPSLSSAFGYGILPLPGGRWLLTGDGVVGGADDAITGIARADGSIETTFGMNGFVAADLPPGGGWDTAIRAVSSGQLAVVCGTHAYNVNDATFVLAGLRGDGAPDAGFAGAGYLYINYAGRRDECKDIVIDAGGNLVAAGMLDEAFAVVRVTPSGQVTQTERLVTTGNGTSLAFGLAIAPNGDVISVGVDSGEGTITRRAGATLELIDTFGGSGVVRTGPGDGPVEVAVAPDGGIIVVGQRGGDTAFVKRFTADGQPDPTFGAGGEVVFRPTSEPTNLRALILDPDGAIVAAGHIGAADEERPLIARFR